MAIRNSGVNGLAASRFRVAPIFQKGLSSVTLGAALVFGVVMGDATGDDLGLVLGAATLLVATASSVVLACPARRKTPVLLSPLHVNGRSALFRGGRYVSKAWLGVISSASAQKEVAIGNVEIMMSGFCSFTATTRSACSHRIITRQNYDEAHHHFSSVSHRCGCTKLVWFGLVDKSFDRPRKRRRNWNSNLPASCWRIF